MSFGFGLKAHSEVSEWTAFPPTWRVWSRVCLCYYCAENELGPVLVSALLLPSGQSSVQLSYRNGFFYQLLDSKSKQKYFSFAVMYHGRFLKQVLKTDF